LINDDLIFVYCLKNLLFQKYTLILKPANLNIPTLWLELPSPFHRMKAQKKDN